MPPESGISTQDKEVDSSVCFSLSDPCDGHIDDNRTVCWYLIDDSLKEGDGWVGRCRHKVKCACKCQAVDLGPVDIESRFCAVGLGSKIYVFGGCPDSLKRVSDKMQFRDTAQKDGPWTPVAGNMNEGRSRFLGAFTRACAGKIFVSGDSCDPDKWVESFDPNSGKWDLVPVPATEPIPSEKFDPRKQYFFTQLPDLGGGLYALDVNTSKWSMIWENCIPDIDPTNHAVVDGILYHLTRFMLNGYDLLAGGSTPPKPVLGLKPGKHLPPHAHFPPSHLVLLGKRNLCLVWNTTSMIDDKRVSKVHCTRFTVSPASGCRFLVANVYSHKAYYVPWAPFIDACVAVDESFWC